MIVKIPLALIIVVGLTVGFFQFVWTEPRNPAVYDQILMQTMNWKSKMALPAHTILMAKEDVPLNSQGALIGMYTKTPVQIIFVDAADLSAKNLNATRARYGTANVYVLRISEPHYKYDWAGMDITFLKPGQSLPLQGAVNPLQLGVFKVVYNGGWQVEKIS
jgi:hypothetical protein